MNKKYFAFSMIIYLCTIIYGFSINEIKILTKYDDIDEKNIIVKTIIKIGSEKENEDFYKPASFAVDSNECIYILDTKNSRVQCFSKEGKFVKSFGKYGQGPGELSKYAMKIKILEDNNIYILDDVVRKIVVYNINGEFLKTMKIDSEYNDIEMIDGKYYLTNCPTGKLDKPIHIIDEKGEKTESFGIVIEPEEGINDKIRKEKKKEVLETFFTSSQFSRIVKNNNNEMIYSLFLPYRLIKYNNKKQMICDVSGSVDYGNKAKFIIVYKNDYPFIMPNLPLPHTFPPIAIEDTIIVPFLKNERDYLYIDKYDNNLKNVQRYKIQERITTEGNILKHVYVDKNNNLYCLIVPDRSDDLPYVIKYEMLI